MFVFSLLGYLGYEANEPVCLINATKIKEKFHELQVNTAIELYHATLIETTDKVFSYDF